MTWVTEFTTDEQSARKVADLVTETFGAEGIAVSLVDAGQGNWRVVFHCSDAGRKTVLDLVAFAEAKSAGTLNFERLSAKDWVGESLAGLKPVMAGRFVIHGAHDRARIAPNRIGIEIEAALAFGTGHHGTTRGCLLALDRICKPLSKPRGGKAPRPILDLGTGSGVLAIAAARALRQRVLATDIDAAAVRAGRANARLNRAGPLIEVVRADGVTSGSVRARAPYDLIFANILLAPLQRLAGPLTRLAAPGARVVLSGLLSSQANSAIAAYHALVLERRIVLDGWTTLVMRRPDC
jgi:ribosomal protein L11 methyltransferase